MKYYLILLSEKYHEIYISNLVVLDIIEILRD